MKSKTSHQPCGNDFVLFFFYGKIQKKKKIAKKPSKIGVWKGEMMKTRRILVYSKERKNKRINTRTYTIIHTVDGLLLLFLLLLQKINALPSLL